MKASAGERCRLAPEELSWRPSPSELAALRAKLSASLPGVIGQRRAVSALRFGLSVRQPGFSLYAVGPPGIGKMTAVLSFLEEFSRKRPTPPDLCYVHNFASPHEPRALRLPPGDGRRFKNDMHELMEHLRREIPKVFERREYADKRSSILQALEASRAVQMEKLAIRAKEAGLSLQVMPFGFLLVPISGGKPLTEQELLGLPAEAREELARRRRAVEEQAKAIVEAIRSLETAARDHLAELDKGAMRFLLTPLLEELTKRYGSADGAGAYLKAVGEDLLLNLELLKREPDAEGPGEPPLAAFLKRFEINLLVDNGATQGAPVVVVSNPTYGDLFGRIEKESRFGGFVTHFTMIQPGALHRANGGFLVVAVEDVVRPLIWTKLKQVLREGRIAIDDPAESFGFMTAGGLRPEATPLDVKTILVGRPEPYYMLQAYDDDFSRVFRVRADFDVRAKRDEQGMADLMAFLGLLPRKEKLLPLDDEAASRLTEHAARLAGDQSYLSTEFGALAEIIREADHWASQEKASAVSGRHVEKALAERVYRSSLYEDNLREMIRQGTLLIQTTGRAIGQVNGLSVLQLGDRVFGRPARITATVGPGREGIVDIEREVELGGPIHSKGILILNGYVVHRFARTAPLSLTARLVMEQSYSGVEGDSASSAELYALLSALADLPIDQGIAVTGSVNQRGEIQAIGRVNEKIEGFFDVCKSRGLTGRQGVIIPHANRRHLMLRSDVVEAVREGRFHVWAAKTVDDGLEILTGVAAGRSAHDGSFTKGSANAAVASRLREFTLTLTPPEPKTEEPAPNGRAKRGAKEVPHVRP